MRLAASLFALILHTVGAPARRIIRGYALKIRIVAALALPFICVPAQAACLGPGVNAGGANNGWTTAPCNSNKVSSGNYVGAATGAAAAIFGGIGTIVQESKQCPALARYNADSSEIDRKHHALWAQMFGDASYAWQLNKEDCEKIRRISEIEIPWRRKSVTLRTAAEAECSPVNWGNGFSPQKFIADFEEANRKCRQILTQPNRQAVGLTASANGAAPAAVSDSCITYGNAYVCGRTLAENGWQTNYCVIVKPSKKPGCPNRPNFVYTEPDGKQSGPWEASPFKVQTVGGPATNIHVVR